MATKLPEHGSCFVCGTQNPHSIGVTWFLQDDGSVQTDFSFTLAHQGPPGHAHGGATAAVLDEAMGAVIWATGSQVVAVNLEINYKKPVPLGSQVKIEARITEVLPRKILTTAEIRLEDGSQAVTGRGIYVEVPGMFEGLGFTDS